MTNTAPHGANRNLNRNLATNFKSLAPFTVGFDTLERIFRESIDDINAPSKYPPYNIVKYSDIEYVIDIAVAGFKKEEIRLEYKDGTLTVSGKEAIPENIEDYINPQYLHKGIAMRDFVHKFRLAAEIEVSDAELVDGILSIMLKKHVPEHQKPKNISIK